MFFSLGLFINKSFGLLDPLSQEVMMPTITGRLNCQNQRSNGCLLRVVDHFSKSILKFNNDVGDTRHQEKSHFYTFSASRAIQSANRKVSDIQVQLTITRNCIDEISNVLGYL